MKKLERTISKREKQTYRQKIALAASSVTALALAPGVADALVVHHVTPLTISMSSGAGLVEWDVDGGGANDFVLTRYVSTAGSTTVLRLNSDGRNGRGLVRSTGAGTSDFNNLPLSFNAGLPLAGGYQLDPFNGGASQRAVVSNTSAGSSFANAVGFIDEMMGYFGFRFDLNGANHFGWAAITIDLNGADSNFTINEWAYENVANAAIHLADTFGLQLRPTGTEKRNPSPEPVSTPPRETLCRAPKTGVITPDAP
jgi:hypothetical protein